MTYTIEGTVTEISSDGIFKIVGNEGYAIKQGDKKYNVLCPADMPKETEHANAIIISQEHQFITDTTNKGLLLNSLGKRVKVTLNIDEVKSYVMSLSSFTVFAN